MTAAAGPAAEHSGRADYWDEIADDWSRRGALGSWREVLVDPKSRDVFAFQAQIVPANRVAVPAP